MNIDKNNLLPTVAIIIVNYNGKKHLQNCFESLQKLNYATDKVEIICVDNNSSDGSVEFIKNNFPEVHCLEAEANLGFAKGCNLGGQAAHSDYLAFLNNDATVHEDWLLALIEALQQNEKAVCAAAKILDWNGQVIDFVEGHLNFYGFAHQIAWQTEVEPGFFDQRKPILFACGGAMLINREIFFEVGGFDEDYFMFFEDVDLGWRLWVLGYEVVFAPEAIAYHRSHGSVGKIAKYRRYFVYERNALATIIKNYEQANLDKILPVALFLSVHRTMDYLEKSDIPADALYPDNWAKLSNKKSKQTIHIEQLNPIFAVRDIIANMPTLIEKRKTIQASRKRSDKEIIKLFGQPLRIYTAAPGAGYSLAQENLMELFQIREIFEGVGKRILLLTKSGLPMFGFDRTTASLRAEAIGKGLEAKGHEVLYSMPANVVKDQPVSKRIKKLGWSKMDLDDIIHNTGPDMVVVCDWEIVGFMKWGVYRPITLDHCAFEPDSDNPDSLPVGRKDFLVNVDFFTCPTENQRKSLILWLKQEGVNVNPQNIQVAPTLLDGSANIEPLEIFCQNPSMRTDKLKYTDTSFSGLPAKVWQILKEGGVEKLKENIYKYITWRKEKWG